MNASQSGATATFGSAAYSVDTFAVYIFIAAMTAHATLGERIVPRFVQPYRARARAHVAGETFALHPGLVCIHQGDTPFNAVLERCVIAGVERPVAGFAARVVGVGQSGNRGEGEPRGDGHQEQAQQTCYFYQIGSSFGINWF